MIRPMHYRCIAVVLQTKDTRYIDMQTFERIPTSLAQYKKPVYTYYVFPKESMHDFDADAAAANDDDETVCFRDLQCTITAIRLLSEEWGEPPAIGSGLTSFCYV